MDNKTAAGGYDYGFVEVVPDSLICSICYLPSRKPCLSECCGHIFCKSCFDLQRAFFSVCPACRSPEFNTVLNKQADRMIRSLHVYCSNKAKGCKWVGEVNAITGHLWNKDGCRYQKHPGMLMSFLVVATHYNNANGSFCVLLMQL